VENMAIEQWKKGEIKFAFKQTITQTNKQPHSNESEKIETQKLVGW